MGLGAAQPPATAAGVPVSTNGSRLFSWSRLEKEEAPPVGGASIMKTAEESAGSRDIRPGWRKIVLIHGLDPIAFAEPAAQAIELPDGEGVPRPEEGDRSVQADSFIFGAAGDVGEDPRAAGLLEGILLEIEVLVAGRDAGVTDEHAALGRGVHARGVSELAGPVKFLDSDFETGIEAGLLGSGEWRAQSSGLLPPAAPQFCRPNLWNSMPNMNLG